MSIWDIGINNWIDLYFANTPLGIAFSTYAVTILCSLYAASMSFKSCSLSANTFDNLTVPSLGDTLVITADTLSPTL